MRFMMAWDWNYTINNEPSHGWEFSVCLWSGEDVGAVEMVCWMHQRFVHGYDNGVLPTEESDDDDETIDLHNTWNKTNSIVAKHATK
mmetsp:Transcript_7630/g.22212  ORF Transcript_7630/g.22212 Transcript_7630/m.22212 type:complete len:87 (-) Transcript_7630:48-308(-)